MPETHYVPLPVPFNHAPNPPPTLSEEQQTKYNATLTHFCDQDFNLTGVEEGKEALTDAEKMWLTKECIIRYLRATKWIQSQAVTRLEATLKWRREFGIYDQMTPEYIEPEAVTGKDIQFGYDVDSRPALYLLPSRENTDGPVRQLQHAIYTLERAFELMGPGVENVVLLIDYADKAQRPNMGVARSMLSYLQNHYPERLGRALFLNVPWLIHLFLKAIMPFLDPVTRNKLHFNPAAVTDGLFVPSQITTGWGGVVEFPYEHEKYWPALHTLCEKRRNHATETWRNLGGTVGLSEYDLLAGEIGTTQETGRPLAEPTSEKAHPPGEEPNNFAIAASP